MLNFQSSFCWNDKLFSTLEFLINEFSFTSLSSKKVIYLDDLFHLFLSARQQNKVIETLFFKLLIAIDETCLSSCLLKTIWKYLNLTSINSKVSSLFRRLTFRSSKHFKGTFKTLWHNIWKWDFLNIFHTLCFIRFSSQAKIRIYLHLCLKGPSAHQDE